jgi:hypothetical protein
LGTAAVITDSYCYRFVEKQLQSQKWGRIRDVETRGNHQIPSADIQRIFKPPSSKLAVLMFEHSAGVGCSNWLFDKFGTEKALTKIVGWPGL